MSRSLPLSMAREEPPEIPILRIKRFVVEVVSPITRERVPVGEGVQFPSGNCGLWLYSHNMLSLHQCVEDVERWLEHRVIRWLD